MNFFNLFVNVILGLIVGLICSGLLGAFYGACIAFGIYLIGFDLISKATVKPKEEKFRLKEEIRKL